MLQARFLQVTSGQISSDLTDAIQSRGGLDYFRRILELRKTHLVEIVRLQKEICALTTPETDFVFVRKLVSSEYLSPQDLDIFARRVFDEHQASQADKAISQTTIPKSIIGLLIGSVAGTLFWWGILYLFKQPFIFIIPVIFIIGYLPIKAFTKQSFKNPVVLAASLLSVGVSLVCGHFLYQDFN